ncbi:hypothetical protein KFE25_002233 [Diacronema lutheri]|uniref:FYVE-type domain-containing protein n=1 Tax=Diacronema lutheri TaxID=2081491 RepID=A0A8J6C9G1_DIALT|nr:hypothetical protein KFE25_002233 [Diacronema lutheri]
MGVASNAPTERRPLAARNERHAAESAPNADFVAKTTNVLTDAPSVKAFVAALATCDAPSRAMAGSEAASTECCAQRPRARTLVPAALPRATPPGRDGGSVGALAREWERRARALSGSPQSARAADGAPTAAADARCASSGALRGGIAGGAAYGDEGAAWSARGASASPLAAQRAASARPAWVADSAPSAAACAACALRFGLFCRRHHCRACGRVFCGACSARACALRELGYASPVRVCEACDAARGGAPPARGARARACGALTLGPADAPRWRAADRPRARAPSAAGQGGGGDGGLAVASAPCAHGEGRAQSAAVRALRAEHGNGGCDGGEWDDGRDGDGGRAARRSSRAALHAGADGSDELGRLTAADLAVFAAERTPPRV